jgi:hypothetical protein
MSGQIDPRLSGGTVFPPLPPHTSAYQDQKPPHPPSTQPAFHQPSRSDSLRADAPPPQYANVNSPQPYYAQYPTPQTQTPSHHPGAGASSIGSVSNQASPELNHAAYQHMGSGVGPTAVGPSSPDQGGDGDGLNPDDPKRPRACEACRGLKVRCDQDPDHPEIPCKRCAKAGRQCIITQPSRKRQKKADSRVAELEKKLDALTAALQAQHASAAQFSAQAAAGAPPAATSGGQYSNAFDDSPTDGTEGEPVRKRQRTQPDGPPYDNGNLGVRPDQSRATSTSGEDPVRKTFSEIQSSWAPTADSKRYLHHTSPEEFTARINSLISPDMAAKVFDNYVTKLAPHLPAVVFPPGTKADQVFQDKPILYVAILSAAAFSMLHIDTTKALAREAVGAIADCVVRNGAKSLELIQSMQVMALWYKPPEKAEQTNFYQIIHMAAVMALDIGLGKRFNPAKARRGFGGPNAGLMPGPHKTPPQDSDTLEARRAWLGCYYLCAR